MSAVLLAAFETPHRAPLAAKQMRDAGHAVREAYSPLQVEELSEAVRRRASRIRQVASWAAFVPVAFELGILFAAFAGFLNFLIEADLTRIHAPVFALDGIERASQDRFMLEIETARPAEARELLADTDAVAITERSP